MKKSIVFCLACVGFLVSGFNAIAQKEKGSALTYISASAKLTKVHTREELEKLGKIELTQLYMERIAILTELIPYMALHTKPGATLQEMGIPETPENKEHLEKEVKNKEAYLASVKETMDDIIPYADKTNIIWSILYFEEMILKADLHNSEQK